MPPTFGGDKQRRQRHHSFACIRIVCVTFFAARKRVEDVGEIDIFYRRHDREADLPAQLVVLNGYATSDTPAIHY